MSTIWTLLRATAVVVGSSAALLTGGIAHADTAPPAPVPNIGSIGQQLANAPQLLQGLTSALGGAPATPPTPPPMASADIRVPQLPANVPGASALAPPATSPTPGTPAAMPGLNSILPGAAPSVPSAAPGAAAPAAGPGQLMPNAQVSLPNVPFSPVPLPQQVSLPGDLASLAPGGVPIPRGMTPPTPAPSAATPAPGVINNPILIPLSALP
ncbi:hypothetical protein [uncultured Mycobacterium sp.]|uniref:hypothetical protein n=1 Tax=uncultured Mycobacterium sp. TaxID=171292 RepID=UPI0035C954E2